MSKKWRVVLKEELLSFYYAEVEIEAETEEEAREIAPKAPGLHELDWNMSYDTETTGLVEVINVEEVM